MVKDKTKILPIITLDDIFGQDLILNPRPPFSNYGWLPKDPIKQDLLTGSPLPVTGNLPVICSDSVITEEVISLLEKANLQVAPFPHIYRTEKEYKDLLDLMRIQNKKLVFNHVHPPNEMNYEGYWIDPEVLGFLNDKANLAKFVPLSHIPHRVTVNSSEIKKAAYLMEFPLVVKAATRQSTGGGYDVIICSSKKEISYACEYFRTCKLVVMEEFIQINTIYNIQFAKTVHGQTIYLGTSEQICTPSGNYLGNWIYKNYEPPKLVMELGRSIMECACSLGFFGIAGFDIAISKDNRVFALDLNFRLNGSTPAQLLKDGIMRSNDAAVLLYRTWKTSIEWKVFMSVCTEFIESKYLIPLSIYNSSSSPYSIYSPFFSGVLVGSSRKDILNKERLLAQHGIT